MADDQPPGPGGPLSGAHQAWSTLGYLIAGVGVWGVVGWLVDSWLGLGGVATGIGVLVGAAGGIYLVIRRSVR
jgi:hypothetical protein